MFCTLLGKADGERQHFILLKLGRNVRFKVSEREDIISKSVATTSKELSVMGFSPGLTGLWVGLLVLIGGDNGNKYLRYYMGVFLNKSHSEVSTMKFKSCVSELQSIRGLVFITMLCIKCALMDVYVLSRGLNKHLSQNC